MSDVSQGPGWWIASDGKWYPPEQQPGYAPPPTPPPNPYGATPPGMPAYGQPAPGAAYGYVPGPVDSRGRPLAEWWQRLVAVLIDGVMLAVVYWILTVIVVSSSIGSHSFTHFGVKLWLVQVVVAVVGIGYFAILEGAEKGQSVGMMALGIAVRDASNGGAIGNQRAGLRKVILYPGLVLVLIPFVGSILGLLAEIWTVVCGLSPLWNPNRQGYHDISQKTVVVKVR